MICFAHIILGAIALSDSFFAEGIKPSVVTFLSCEGDEAMLTECLLNDRVGNTCGKYKDAEIVCQGTYNCDSIIHCALCAYLGREIIWCVLMTNESANNELPKFFFLSCTIQYTLSGLHLRGAVAPP